MIKKETMEFSDMTPELQEKAKACKTPEEMLALAKAEGIELTEEQLDGIAAGGFWDKEDNCPRDDSCEMQYCISFGM